MAWFIDLSNIRANQSENPCAFNICMDCILFHWYFIEFSISAKISSPESRSQKTCEFQLGLHCYIANTLHVSYNWGVGRLN